MRTDQRALPLDSEAYKPHFRELTTTCATRLLALMLVLTQPGVVEAQFTFTTNSGALTITGYTGSGGAVVIPSEINGLPVTSIGNNAFETNRNLTSVTIPDSATNIGDSAFSACSSLASITIGTNVITIGSTAFSGCTNLTGITIPNSVTNLGIYTFWGCSRLASITIPNRVKRIGEAVFVGCSSMTNVTIPASVTMIRDGAFYLCSGLTGVYFKGNAPLLGMHVFDLDNSATVYYLPGTTNWGRTYGERPTALWQPQMQTGDASFGVQTNQFGFNITWASGQVVVVEASENLANPIWSPLQTNTLSGDSLYFSDPQWTNYPGRFYRIRSP